MSQKSSINRPFIRGAVAIESMRDNGYKNAAYALAELIDNSIQAKADNVQLICYEHIVQGSSRNTKNVQKIAIFDNGKGMSAEVLHLALEFGGSQNRSDPNGMGKFGMGLPNSSISQCQRVEVWSWQNGEKPHHTYLDIEEMKDGMLETIPYPATKDLPDEYTQAVTGPIPSSGTFILWTKLDRLQWKTSASIYKHSEALVGQMYRKYIGRSQARVCFKPLLFDEKTCKYVSPKSPLPAEFRANDPLYLTVNSSLPDLPGDFKGQAAFEVFDKDKVTIDIDGEKHDINIIVTKIKDDVLKAIRSAEESKKFQKVGSTVWGKHFASNVGLSVMRSDRELESKVDFFSNREFLNYKARYMGIEVCFGPALDKIFGVANNKQTAVNFRYMNIDEDFEQQGFDSVEDYEKDLNNNGDTKLKLYELSNKIIELIKKTEKKLNTLSFDIVNENAATSVNRTASVTVMENKARERSEEGKAPDPDIEIPEDVKNRVIKTIQQNSSISEEEAASILEEIINNQERFRIEPIKSSNTMFFDVASFEGLTLLQLNENHPFYQKLLQNAPDEQRMLLELCLGAWAQMEIEAISPRQKENFKLARDKWGEMLHDYLDISEG